MCPAKTQISLSINAVWSEALPYTQWIAKDPMILHADSEDWSVCADLSSLAANVLLVLSCSGSPIFSYQFPMNHLSSRTGTKYRYIDASWYIYRYACSRIMILSEIRLATNLIHFSSQNKFWYILFFHFCSLPDQKSKETQIIVR